MSLLRTLASSALVVVAGCGSDDPDLPTPPVPDGTPKEQVAQTVNEMFDAWNAGDGELACGYMTPRGQRLAVRIARQLHQMEEGISPSDCISAIADSAAATDETIGQTATPEAVSIEGNRASVASEFRGALAMRRVDDVWRVDIPTFID